MILHSRSVSVAVAVIFFFGISLVGWFFGLPPFVCCKRACLAAVLAYLAATVAVRAINGIITNAIIDDHISRTRGRDRAAGN